MVRSYPGLLRRYQPGIAIPERVDPLCRFSTKCLESPVCKSKHRTIEAFLHPRPSSSKWPHNPYLTCGGGPPSTTSCLFVAGPADKGS